MTLSVQIDHLAQQAWSTVTGEELTPTERERPFREGDIWSTVVIHGPAECGVMLCCSQALARRMTGQMLGLSADEISLEDTFDAIGEMVNIIGGNLKQQIPGATALSLPCVALGNGIFNRPNATQHVDCRVFCVEDELLEVLVVHQPALVGSTMNGSTR